MRQTTEAARSWKELEYVGAADPYSDESGSENLIFHFNLLLQWLGNLYELDDYHCCGNVRVQLNEAGGQRC